MTVTPAETSTPPASHLKAACFTPLSYFERLLDLDDYTQLRIFGLILVETLGAWPKPRQEAEITVDRMAETFSVSREWVLNAISRLSQSGLITIGKSPRGATCYAIAKEYIEEARSAGHHKIRGRCPHCKAIGLFSTEFIPVPHAAFRRLGGCIDSAAYRCAMVIARYTMSWNKEARELNVKAKVLDIADFERLTGLDKRQILRAIQTLLELGLIGRQKRPGKESFYWAIPATWGTLDRRDAREITPPERESKNRENTGDSKNTEKSNESSKTGDIESRPWFYGRCLNCDRFVDIEPVTEEEFLNSNPPEPPKTPESPPRAGPKREKMTKQDEAWEILRKRYAR